MEIGYIAPAWDLIRGKKQLRIFLLAPLTFPVLAALTPEDIEVEIIDERLRPIPYEANFRGFLTGSKLPGSPLHNLHILPLPGILFLSLKESRI